MEPDEATYEALSRLLDGDLPEGEAAALRERIRNEPAVAAAHEELQRVVTALEGLDEVHVPPPLPASVYPSRQSSSPRWTTWAPGAVAVAAVGLLLLRSPASPELVLVAGENLVGGQLQLTAGDTTIDLDGRARILVEPQGTLDRVADQRPLEPTMKIPLVAGAVAGALVTITVYEGTAAVRSPDGTTVHVPAGQEQAFGTPAPAASGPRGTTDSAATLEDRVAALDAELQATRKQLLEAQFSGALVRGQLSAERGSPSEWTGLDVPASFSPAQFEASLQKQLEDLPDFELSRVSCEEYPCIGVIHHIGSGDDANWNDPLGPRIEDWTKAELGDAHSLSNNTSRFRNGDTDERYVIFGAYTEGGDDVKARTDWRIDQLVEQLGSELSEH